MARHAELIDHESGSSDTVAQILAGAIDYVGDAVHATVTASVNRRHTLLGASSPVAVDAARCQFTLRQGPSVDALTGTLLNGSHHDCALTGIRRPRRK